MLVRVQANQYVILVSVNETALLLTNFDCLFFIKCHQILISDEISCQRVPQVSYEFPVKDTLFRDFYIQKC